MKRKKRRRWGKKKSAYEEHPQNSVYLFPVYFPSTNTTTPSNTLKLKTKKESALEVHNFPFIFNAKFSLSYDDAHTTSSWSRRTNTSEALRCACNTRDNARKSKGKLQYRLVKGKMIFHDDDDFSYVVKVESSSGMRRSLRLFPPPGKTIRQWKCA